MPLPIQKAELWWVAKVAAITGCSTESFLRDANIEREDLDGHIDRFSNRIADLAVEAMRERFPTAITEREGPA